MLELLFAFLEMFLELERANPVPKDGEFSEEVEDMLERTRTNPNAIIYGTFYSYPVM